MSDLNQCNFIGRLGGDPETRFTQGGSAVTNVNLACNWKSKEKEGVEWVRVVFFGKLAEVVGEYTEKGALIFVSGRMQTRKWEDNNGNDRYTTEIVAHQMTMLGRKGGAPFDEGGQGHQPPAGEEGLDDDIPFA